MACRAFLATPFALFLLRLAPLTHAMESNKRGQLMRAEESVSGAPTDGDEALPTPSVVAFPVAISDVSAMRPLHPIAQMNSFIEHMVKTAGLQGDEQHSHFNDSSMISLLSARKHSSSSRTAADPPKRPEMEHCYHSFLKDLNKDAMAVCIAKALAKWMGELRKKSFIGKEGFSTWDGGACTFDKDNDDEENCKISGSTPWADIKHPDGTVYASSRDKQLKDGLCVDKECWAMMNPDHIPLNYFACGAEAKKIKSLAALCVSEGMTRVMKWSLIAGAILLLVGLCAGYYYYNNYYLCGQTLFGPQHHHTKKKKHGGHGHAGHALNPGGQQHYPAGNPYQGGSPPPSGPQHGGQAQWQPYGGTPPPGAPMGMYAQSPGGPPPPGVPMAMYGQPPGGVPHGQPPGPHGQPSGLGPYGQPPGGYGGPPPSGGVPGGSM